MAYPIRRIHNPEVRDVVGNQGIFTVKWAPPAADDNYFKTSTSLAAQTTTLLAASMTKSKVAYMPVCPVVVITNNVASGETAWTSVSCTFVGVDQFGITQSHTVDGVNSSNTWTCTSTIAFVSLTSVSFTVTGGTACDTSDTYIIGYAKTYGLMRNIAATGDVIQHHFESANDAGTISVAWNTYTFNGTPDGTKEASFIVCSSAL